jgi:hypothetical protein
MIAAPANENDVFWSEVEVMDGGVGGRCPRSEEDDGNDDDEGDADDIIIGGGCGGTF